MKAGGFAYQQIFVFSSNEKLTLNQICNTKKYIQENKRNIR